MRILILTAVLFLNYPLAAQSDCACCTPQHQQFDFWIGEWIVYDTAGTKVGENLITKLEDNCVISEQWRGASGLTGRSYNYFHPADSSWNQLWLDNQGSNLLLKGRAAPNKMILQSELTKGQQIDWYRNRITWTKNADGTVTQLWEILDKEGKLLSVAFKGIYRRKG